MPPKLKVREILEGFFGWIPEKIHEKNVVGVAGEIFNEILAGISRYILNKPSKVALWFFGGISDRIFGRNPKKNWWSFSGILLATINIFLKNYCAVILGKSRGIILRGRLEEIFEKLSIL